MNNPIAWGKENISTHQADLHNFDVYRRYFNSWHELIRNGFNGAEIIVELHSFQVLQFNCSLRSLLS